MSFDADQFAASFMGATTEGEMATERVLPDMGIYKFKIRNDQASGKDFLMIHAKAGESQDKETGATRPWIILNVPCEIIERVDIPDTKFAGRLARWSSFIDLDDAGQMSTAKDDNVNLGKLRAAVGQNVAGQHWNPYMLDGAVFLGQLNHRPDRSDPQKKYAEVINPAPVGKMAT